MAISKPLAELKQIYQSVTEEAALLEFDQFCDRWDDKYPQISRSWRTHWHNLNTLLNLPEDIHKAIKKRKLFPTGDSAKKEI